MPRVPIDPGAEARQKQHEKEQARRKRLMKQRAETLDHILDSAPATFTAPQLRVLPRALIHIDSYDIVDDLAAHFVKDDEYNQQTGEDVLLSVLDRLEEDKLSGFPFWLALTGHADIPRENKIDHLAEAEAVFAQPQSKKGKAKKATTKKTAPIKTKTEGLVDARQAGPWAARRTRQRTAEDATEAPLARLELR